VTSWRNGWRLCRSYQIYLDCTYQKMMMKMPSWLSDFLPTARQLTTSFKLLNIRIVLDGMTAHWGRLSKMLYLAVSWTNSGPVTRTLHFSFWGPKESSLEDWQWLLEASLWREAKVQYCLCYFPSFTENLWARREAYQYLSWEQTCLYPTNIRKRQAPHFLLTILSVRALSERRQSHSNIVEHES